MAAPEDDIYAVTNGKDYVAVSSKVRFLYLSEKDKGHLTFEWGKKIEMGREELEEVGGLDYFLKTLAEQNDADLVPENHRGNFI